jgi:hypothetical protein
LLGGTTRQFPQPLIVDAEEHVEVPTYSGGPGQLLQQLSDTLGATAVWFLRYQRQGHPQAPTFDAQLMNGLFVARQCAREMTEESVRFGFEEGGSGAGEAAYPPSRGS